MANILISFYQPIIDNNQNNLFCYYESFITELQRNNNNIFVINDKLCENNDKKRIAKQISNFKPDLIITFNNKIQEEFIKATNCPIALLDADTIPFWKNLSFIKKYNDRYYMITSYEGLEKDYKNLGFKEDRITNIHLATSIRRENIEQDKNISFIGTNFTSKRSNINNFIKNDSANSLYKIAKEMWLKHDCDYEEYFSEQIKNNTFNELDVQTILDRRNYILTSVLDLGLNLYGVDWNKSTNLDYILASAFINKQIYTLKHNQDIYNSSKINLSISHQQCKGYSFPWRIYDIMASNGLLITSRADLLKKQTKGYVDIPMYETPYDARDLCKKFLKEENLRKDIIDASNEFIEKFGRWDSNFKRLEELLNIKLLNNDGNSSIIFPECKITQNKDNKKYKNIYLGLLLSISNLPIMNNFYSNRHRTNLYDKIEKYKW